MVNLGGLHPLEDTYAFEVNESSQVAGMSKHPDGPPRAIYWSEETGLLDITHPSYFSAASDINDSGVVLCLKFKNTNPVGSYLWQKGTITELPFVGRAINNEGYIVGGQMIFRESGLANLNTMIPPGFSVLQALDINNEGVVLAHGLDHGVANTLILTPVPEPAPQLVLLVLLVATGVRLRRRSIASR
jgi:uncharacterized membrane protein